MSSEISKDELRIYENKQVSLSNALIQAREKTSLLESKIELLAIYRMKDEMNSVTKLDAKGKPYSVHQVVITAPEIKQLSGRSGGSIYTDIESAAFELKQKLYVYRDPVHNQFKMDSLYGEVEYKDGILTIDFNPATEHLFLELTDNFTKLRLDIAFSFQTNGGFQLYKILKSYAYVLPDIDLSKPQEEQAIIEKQYSLSELRLQLGYVDLNQPDIKKEGSKAHPDADKMNALEKKPKYKRWSDFDSRVIEPGVTEINNISDIYIVSVDKILGAHGKVEGVKFKIQNNLAWYQKAKKDGKDVKEKKDSSVIIPVTEEEIDKFLDDMTSVIKINLKVSELKAIAKAAVYDMSKVKKAYEVLEDYSSPIDNVAAFMVKAINENWEVPTKRKAANSTKGGFSDFEQRNYDYDALEEILIANK